MTYEEFTEDLCRRAEITLGVPYHGLRIEQPESSENHISWEQVYAPIRKAQWEHTKEAFCSHMQAKIKEYFEQQEIDLEVTLVSGPLLPFEIRLIGEENEPPTYTD